MLDDNDKTELISQNPSIMQNKVNFNMFKIIHKLTEVGFFDFMFQNKEDKEAFLESMDLDWLEENIQYLDYPDKFNEHFLQRGWVAHGFMHTETMKNAVDIADDKGVDEAERYLVDAYGDDLKDIMFLLNYPPELKKRQMLIETAYDDFINERYHSCILLLLTIIDGFVADTNINMGRGFFNDSTELYAWDSIAAHKTGLIELHKLLYCNRGNTNLEKITIPYRNGILHGRDLNFANKECAVKLWSALFAIKEGVRDIINNGTESRIQERTSFKDVIELMRYNENLKKACDEWVPRELKKDTDFSESGFSEEYDENSPEKRLVEFFEYWKSKNFGYMVDCLDYFSGEDRTLKDKAGILSREFFKGKTLVSFRILDINDEGAAVTNIATKLTINVNDKEITEEFPFRMIYLKSDDGKIGVRNFDEGSWKIVSILGIKELI